MGRVPKLTLLLKIKSNPTFPPSSPEPLPPAPVDVYRPLLSDEMRKEELGDRLSLNALGRQDILQVHDSILEKQVQIEKKIEQALLSAGYSRDSSE